MSQDDIPDLATPQAGKVAPEAVALRAQPRPVTRLNRRTLAILAGGLSVGVMGALIWSLQPQQRGAGESTELYNVDRVSRSEGLDALPADYSKLPALPPDVPELGPPLPGDLGPAIVNSQQPVAATYAAPGYDPNDALRKEEEAAAASSVFFRTGSLQAAPVAQSQDVAAPGFAANAAFDPLAAGPASTAAQPADPTTVQNRQDQKEAFLAGNPTETRNSGNLQMPASPYQVMAGTVIAGALVTGIKSDLPGDVIATVTEPIYDTATGNFLLIPQGSRILASTTARSATAKAACRWCEPHHPAGHVIADARQPDRHRPSGICRSGRRRGLALGSDLCRCGADHAAGRRCRTGRTREPSGR